MKFSNKYFPYPIITPDFNDYSKSIFDCEIDIKRNINSLDFSFNINNTDEILKNMITKGDLEYAIHFECTQTAYRTIVTSSSNFICKSIVEDDIKGLLSICVVIVAKKDILDYTNDNFNTDYNGFTFNFKRGSILGIAKEVDIPIHKELEDFEKIPSIFVIAKDKSNETSGMKIELSGDKIKLYLNEEDFSMYVSYSKNIETSNIVGCALVLPALIYTFERINNMLCSSEDDLSIYRWYQVIEHVLKKKGLILNKDLLDNMESYELAQKLLNLPLTRAFESIASLSTLTEEDE